MAAVSEAMDAALQPLPPCTCLPSPLDTAAATVTPTAPRASRAASAAASAAEAAAKAAANAAAKPDADWQAARRTFNAGSELSEAQLVLLLRHVSRTNVTPSDRKAMADQDRASALRARATELKAFLAEGVDTDQQRVDLACSLINDNPGKNRPLVVTLLSDGLLRGILQRARPTEDHSQSKRQMMSGIIQNPSKNVRKRKAGPVVGAEDGEASRDADDDDADGEEEAVDGQPLTTPRPLHAPGSPGLCTAPGRLARRARRQTTLTKTANLRDDCKAAGVDVVVLAKRGRILQPKQRAAGGSSSLRRVRWASANRRRWLP
jgi:hypothetical protein